MAVLFGLPDGETTVTITFRSVADGYKAIELAQKQGWWVLASSWR